LLPLEFRFRIAPARGLSSRLCFCSAPRPPACHPTALNAPLSSRPRLAAATLSPSCTCLPPSCQGLIPSLFPCTVLPGTQVYDPVALHNVVLGCITFFVIIAGLPMIRSSVSLPHSQAARTTCWSGTHGGWKTKPIYRRMCPAIARHVRGRTYERLSMDLAKQSGDC